ncbi:MAG: LysM peptidoglycan-binding domain-containing protein, partial [Candidatus Thiodiazotropha sp. (ex Dulcina madagascariensis)]|nr:LysM peptidoglycan-binding domain-containing protein [Candidatus Thiodiazotropha sp. (ex Dulcina madagascariensis)]
IPNLVANSVNTKESYKVYSESEIIGSTSPEVLVKKKKKSWAQMLVMVIIAIIVVVIAIYTGYVATELFGWAAGVSAAAGGVVTTAAAFTAAAVAAAAVGYAAGYATSAITQGLAIAVDLQEDFDWGAARDMGKSFAISSVAAGITSVAGAGNATGQVLTRGAVQMGRQYLENDGKITNWAGVALAMVGTKGVSETSNWSGTVSFVNENRNLVGAGLSVAEKFARGREVNTLDWTNVAASAISGRQAGGSGFIDGGKINWDKVARHALVSAGLSLVVGHRYGRDAGLNYFGSQLGAVAGEIIVEGIRENNPSATAVSETLNNASSPFERRQGLNQAAEDRREAERSEEQALAESQQADESWEVDLPDELEWRDGQSTASAAYDPDAVVDTGWGSVLGGPDGLTFTDGMRAELSQTNQTARSSVIASSGDSISSILGTSDSIAVEAFMRANGLSDSAIYAGEQYVMPSGADYDASTGEMGQAALNQDNARIAGNRTDQNRSPLPDAGVDLEVDVNLGFLHPNGPGSRAESLQMMDHGLMDAQRQEQLKNIAPIMEPINEWWEGVKGRVSLSISDPVEALDQGLSKSFPLYDRLGQVTQEELSQAVNRASKGDGKLDLNPQAFDELAGSLPLSGVAGITRGILNKAPNRAVNAGLDLSKLKPGQSLPDNLEIIVTGSNNKPGNFILRPGVDDKAIGDVLTPGKSATIATDLSLETEITTMFGRASKRGDTLSAGFVEDVRAAGFDVIFSPTAKNPRHVRIVPNASNFDEAGRELLSEALDRIARQRK